MAKKEKAPFWVRVEELLSRPKRKRRGVNLSKIAKFSKEGQTVVAVDKVLGAGAIKHALTLAAPSLSETAAKVLRASGVKVVSIDEAKKANPTGKDLVIIS